MAGRDRCDDRHYMSGTDLHACAKLSSVLSAVLEKMRRKQTDKQQT